MSGSSVRSSTKPTSPQQRGQQPPVAEGVQPGALGVPVPGVALGEQDHLLHPGGRQGEAQQAGGDAHPAPVPAGLQGQLQHPLQRRPSAPPGRRSSPGPTIRPSGVWARARQVSGWAAARASRSSSRAGSRVKAVSPGSARSRRTSDGGHQSRSRSGPPGVSSVAVRVSGRPPVRRTIPGTASLGASGRRAGGGAAGDRRWGTASALRRRQQEAPHPLHGAGVLRGGAAPAAPGAAPPPARPAGGRAAGAGTRPPTGCARPAGSAPPAPGGRSSRPTAGPSCGGRRGRRRSRPRRGPASARRSAGGPGRAAGGPGARGRPWSGAGRPADRGGGCRSRAG